MKPSSNKVTAFDIFRIKRAIDLRDAIDLVDSMRHTMPASRYRSYRMELEQELDELLNDDVIQFSHIRLLAESSGYRR